MKINKALFSIALAVGCGSALSAQNEFYNNGADVYVQAGGLIYVQGEVINDDEGANVGRMYNSGDIQLTGNWSNTSLVSNVFQAFDIGTTTFLGTGAVQTIGGTMDTYFNNLTLNKPAATLEVRQLRNSLCDGVLNLTNDFLNTQTFTFLVANPNPAAITRTGPVVPNYTNDMTLGYVTSTPGSTGRLARATSPLFPGAIYFYPLGNGTRFRPIEITPTSVGNNAYSAQFVNLPTPNTNLKVASLNTINPGWYHFIERQVAAGSPENIRIYHDFTNDNVCDINYVTMSEWSLGLGMWDDLSPTSSTMLASPILSWTQKTGYPGTYATPWISNAFALAGLFVSPGIGSCVFPVEMTPLRATALDKTIMLNWQTQSELNNMGFEVERSTDAVNFSPIGWVAGAGTTTVPQDYQLEDADVAPNVRYFYRLRQRDMNGGESYSNVAEAILTGNESFVLGDFFPNPTNSSTFLWLASDENVSIHITLYNKLGQIVLDETHELPAGYQKLEFDFAGRLAQGVYTANVDAGTRHFTRKLVME